MKIINNKDLPGKCVDCKHPLKNHSVKYGCLQNKDCPCGKKPQSSSEVSRGGAKRSRAVEGSDSDKKSKIINSKEGKAGYSAVFEQHLDHLESQLMNARAAVAAVRRLRDGCPCRPVQPDRTAGRCAQCGRAVELIAQSMSVWAG